MCAVASSSSSSFRGGEGLRALFGWSGLASTEYVLGGVGSGAATSGDLGLGGSGSFLETWVGRLAGEPAGAEVTAGGRGSGVGGVNDPESGVGGVQDGVLTLLGLSTTVE